MGFVQLTQIKDYWSTHVTLNLPFFTSVFSRDRFLQIFWMLHVGEHPSTTVQLFLDLIIPLFQQYLTPSRELSVDEAMIALRGRVAFQQYIPGKPQPWGSRHMYSQRVERGIRTILRERDSIHHSTTVKPHNKCSSHSRQSSSRFRV